MKTKGKVKSHRQVQGLKSGIKGLLFEQKVIGHFSKQGWKNIQPRKKIQGREIDIYGEQEDFLGDKSYLLVECKDKASVTSADVISFMKKVQDFDKRLSVDILGDKPPVIAFIAYTGNVVKDAKDVAQNFRPKIKFKKF